MTPLEKNVETANGRTLEERDMLSRSCHAQRDVTTPPHKGVSCHGVTVERRRRPYTARPGDVYGEGRR